MVWRVAQERMLMLATGCNNNKHRNGFTLIELLVVLFIIGISATLITLSFNSINSIEKQTNSIENSVSFLSEESIITGNIITWYFNSNNHFASYISDDGEIIEVNGLNESVWKNNSTLKKTLKYSDGIKIELADEKLDVPLLVFYPSGEISGGEIEVFYEEYIYRLVVKNNGKIQNEIINY